MRFCGMRSARLVNSGPEWVFFQTGNKYYGQMLSWDFHYMTPQIQLILWAAPGLSCSLLVVMFARYLLPSSSMRVRKHRAGELKQTAPQTSCQMEGLSSHNLLLLLRLLINTASVSILHWQISLKSFLFHKNWYQLSKMAKTKFWLSPG